MKIEIKEAKRILALVASDPHHGVLGATEDQDTAARVVLRELRRLAGENRALKKELKFPRRRV